ncbi:MAG: glycosyltransferase [Rhodospirillales bacterium]
MSLSFAALAGLVALAAWVALVLFRGAFWRADQRLEEPLPGPDSWPGVVVIVPARNEAATVGRCIDSLLGQAYPGPFSVILVDDGSDDGTAAAARAAAAGSGRLSIVGARPPDPAWTGKLWAVAEGLAHADTAAPEAPFVLFTDADIAHDRESLRRLVSKAEAEGLDLVSLMVLLNCRGAWERLLIPAFVFFFQKLYPFPLVNDAKRPEAAAAGGCMLVRRAALGRVGGVEAIRGRLIDDCALGASLKRNGPIWLGLTRHLRSLRDYPRLKDIWDMVARTAFEQLRHSAAALAGTVLAMAVIYLAPPAAAVAGAVTGDPVAGLAGLAGWSLMAFAYRPTVRLYGQGSWRALLLPAAALLFTLMTVDSAKRHWAGRGGAWKGRNRGGFTQGPDAGPGGRGG